MLCLICGKELTDEYFKGVLFEGTAVYGSSFDMGTFDLVVCDDCIQDRSDRIRMISITTLNSRTKRVIPWD